VRWQGVGNVVLLDLTDMVTLMIECNVMGIRRVVGSKMLLTGSKRPEKTTDGIRVKMSARPLLERMNFDAALAAHLGTDFLDTLEIEQIQGGPENGYFVAQDAVAKLLGMRADNASQKIKNIVCPVPENFPSCTLLKGTYVSLVNFLFCTTKISHTNLVPESASLKVQGG
jgi:hypothetical protein